MSANAGDVFGLVIEAAVERGVRKALPMSDVPSRRLFSPEDAGVYLDLSRREIDNMIARKELPSVKRGSRRMLDVRDLDAWIERNKV